MNTFSLATCASIVALSCCCGSAQQPLPASGQAPSVPVPAPLGNVGRASQTASLTSADASEDHAAADPSKLPAVLPAGRPVIGIAFEGGGALGLAHAGVIQWLEENHIPIDRVAGTSMGALIGGLYSAGKSPQEIEKIAESPSFQDVFTVAVPYTDINFRRREDRRELPQALTFGLKGGPSLRNALLEDGGLNEFLTTILFNNDSDGLDYDRLPIPFRCVATDLNSMHPVVFYGGPLPQAIRASISIPGVFPPVERKGHYLVDGAIVDNLPTGIVRQDLHADVVIGVDLKDPPFQQGDVGSLVSVFARAYSVGTARNERIGAAGADILIRVDTSAYKTGDYAKAAKIVQVGYEAAAANAEALRKYALNQQDWASYVSARQSRIRPDPGKLLVAQVEGGAPDVERIVGSGLNALKGQPSKAADLNLGIQLIEGNGTYQASVTTFDPQTRAPTEQQQALAPDTGIRVRLTPVRNGPPFLLFGMSVGAENSNVTRTTFDFRLLNTNLGGFGSELRSDVRLGFLTQLSTEYYRLLTPSGYFIEPKVGIIRKPVYLWANQQRISEHLEQQGGGGLEIGRTANRNLQVSLAYNAQILRWHPVSGVDGTPTVSGGSQSAYAHVVYDSTRSGVLSSTGSRVEATVGALFHTVNSGDAPLLRFHASRSLGLSTRSTLLGAVDGNSYMRRNVTEALRFTVGGPLKLSASSIDEYRGTDNYLVRAGVVHRLASLPTGYGEGIYAGFAYEGAEVWAPERRAILRQDGVFTVIGVTPIGALTLGGSLGDAGHKKVFFTFGRLF